MPRFCVYKVRSKCPECGNPVILDGPLRSVECPSCFHVLDISPDAWKTVLGYALDEYRSLSSDHAKNISLSAGGLTLSVKVQRQMPRCPSCSEPFPLDIIPETADGPIFCGQCGKRSSSHLVPDWLKELLPADRLYCAATEEDPNGAQELSVPNADKPVLMACMGCGASLSITMQSERVSTCSHCEAENFLPDPLWRRLHPVKKRIPWYVRYRD